MPRKKSTHVDDPAAAGLRLKAAREAAGVSQRRLAFPGCSAAYISRVEAGTRIASLPILRGLAERLGVTEAYLCSGGSATARSALDDAEIALRLDHTDEAAQLFENALMDAGSDPERARAFEGLGQLAQRAGNPQLAVDLFEKALSLVQDDVAERPSLAEGLARSYAALGQMARSISILERCVEASENDPVQYIRFAGLLGAALTDNGSFAEAERVLAHAISRGREVKDPYTRARLYWSESRLHLEQGQTELAARYARRTLDILRATEDGYAIAHALQSLAHVYLDLGRSEDALELLEEGRRSHPRRRHAARDTPSTGSTRRAPWPRTSVARKRRRWRWPRPSSYAAPRRSTSGGRTRSSARSSKTWATRPAPARSWSSRSTCSRRSRRADT